MPEILFITNDINLLKSIDQLKALVNVRIDIVNDFSQGLKEIFFRQPDVVFIQCEIDGITGEKVASQVRALLDEKPIRLILLNNNMSEWPVADSNFNSSIDVSLPPKELIRQLQQLIYDALDEVPEKPAVALETLHNDTVKVELSIDSEKPVDEYSIDSLADIFPANLPDDWGTPLNDQEKGEQTATGTVEPVVEKTNPVEEFTFDTLPDISLVDPDGSATPPLLPEAGQLQDSQWKNSHPWQEPTGDRDKSEEGLYADYHEPIAHLPAGMGSETFPEIDFQSGSTITEVEGVRPEPAPAFIDRPTPLGARSSSSAAAAEPSQRASAPVVTLPQLPPTAQKETPHQYDGSVGIQAGKGEPTFSSHSPLMDFADDTSFREDFGKKSSLTFKLFSGVCILIISIAIIFIVRDWMGGPEPDPLSGALSPAPLYAPPRDLPAFIPGVAPDSAYAAAHPGWERRIADGLEYLIYREKNRIKVIQVIAGAEGVISVPFLKTCIRETTGREDAENWVREKRDDFQVEKGTLGKKGELAVYRKLPELDIRGFVLSYN